MAIADHRSQVEAQPPRAARRRWRHLIRVLAPAGLYLGVRLVGVLCLAWMTEVNGGRLGEKLSAWDGQWLLAIAGGGYGGVPPGLVDAYGERSAETPLAFFPGYPFAVGLTRFVTGTEPLVAGLVVSLVAGVVAAYGLARLGELVPGGSPRAGLLLVGLFAAAPMAVVLSMTYSEALFCACAVWALVGVLRRDWLLAGSCAALAGLVRPTAAAVVAAVGLAALVAVAGRRDTWRAWAGGLLAPLGLLGYLAFVAANTGSPFGWFALQERGWNSGFDGGAATVEFSYEVLATGRSVLETVTVAVLVGALVLLAVAVRERLPWPLLVYAVVVLIMGLGSSGLMNSKARLLLPAFTLLVPAALAMSRRRPGTAVAVVLAATLASAWFGAYALNGWRYAI